VLSLVTNGKSKKITTRLAISIFVMSTGAIVSFFVLSMVFTVKPSPIESAKDRDANTATEVAVSQVYGPPVRLAIPKIDVETSISYMGLTASGDMEAPKTNEDAGWYKYGPHPGNTGSAVIAGHLGVGNDAIFAQLDVLAKGDIVNVTDDRGQTASFQVTHTRTYAYDAEPSEVFNSTMGTHLNLITCEGDWNSATRTYSARLVVFTDKIS